ncbi:MAG: hypothetical protein JPMHGGIA_02831 [Saprospiraceae bacterium]|nr:hypothetical protein [Saprospiraceae bacterium]
MRKYFQHVQNGTKNLITKYYLVLIPFLLLLLWHQFIQNNSFNGVRQSSELLKGNEQLKNNKCYESFVNNSYLESPKYSSQDSSIAYAEFLNCILADNFNNMNGFKFSVNTEFDTSYILVDFGLPEILKFNVYDYRLPSDFIATQEYQELKHIFQSIRDIKIRFNLLMSNLLLSKHNIENRSVKLKIDVNFLIYLFQQAINKLQNKKTTILIKGYADGSIQNDWKRNLNYQNRDNYRNIEYYPFPNSIVKSDYEYHLYDNNVEKHEIIGNLYSNCDLPFLRAKYVADELIQPLLKMNNLDDIEIKILEGKVFDEVYQKPKLRFVDIYVKFEL